MIFYPPDAGEYWIDLGTVKAETIHPVLRRLLRMGCCRDEFPAETREAQLQCLWAMLTALFNYLPLPGPELIGYYGCHYLMTFLGKCMTESLLFSTFSKPSSQDHWIQSSSKNPK